MDSSELFDRLADLVVGQRRVTGLRATFTISKSLKKEPNTLDLRVWNLARDTRGALQPKGTPVVLVAGYAGDTGQIFAGDSRTVDTTNERADVVTRIQCGDGEKAYSVTRFSESYAPGTRLVTVLEAVIRKLGLNPGNALERVRQGGFRAGFEQFPHGYTASGRASDELDRLLRSAGLAYSIQDGTIQVLAPAEFLADEVVELSSSSGLIGSPAHGSPAKEGEPPLLKARSLLRHVYRPGRRVKIAARNVSGLFRIERVTHTGDTKGGDWFSDLEVKPV